MATSIPTNIDKENLALRVAIYARFSTDLQRATSLDDQISRCKQHARNYGLEVSPDLIFSDAALSGTAKATAKRDGYNSMMAKLKAGEIDVLIVDEVSRLSRDVVDYAHFTRLLENNPKLRVLTTDGMDSATPQWQISFGILGLVAQQAVRDTRHRVERGMRGTLERGYMCAYPPLGYRMVDIRDEKGSQQGTKWEIVEAQANIVRSVFEQRSKGLSMHQIASKLNEDRVPTNSGVRARESQYWRPARVKQMLANPIYKGEYHHRGSAKYKAEQAKKGLVAEVEIFLRPELRIVSDELWERCNSNKVSRSGYGGGKNALSGLLSCGVCGSTLAVSSGRTSSKSAYCARCVSDKSMMGDPNANTSTVAISGIREMLHLILADLLTPELIALFHERLHERLTGSFTQEINDLEKQILHWSHKRDRLSAYLGGDNDDVIKLRYDEAKVHHEKLELQLKKLQEKSNNVDHDAVRKQLSQYDPIKAIEKLLMSENVPPEQVRSVLCRLFPSIVFEGKSETHCAHFTVTLSVGEAIALASQSCEVVPMTEVRKYTLRFSPKYRSGVEQKWSVIREAGALDLIPAGKNSPVLYIAA